MMINQNGNTKFVITRAVINRRHPSNSVILFMNGRGTTKKSCFKWTMRENPAAFSVVKDRKMMQNMILLTQEIFIKTYQWNKLDKLINELMEQLESYMGMGCVRGGNELWNWTVHQKLKSKVKPMLKCQAKIMMTWRLPKVCVRKRSLTWSGMSW